MNGTDKQCQDCRNAYDGADGVLRCRVNGLAASRANAGDCKRFDDKKEPWFSGAWECDAQGRGD